MAENIYKCKNCGFVCSDKDYVNGTATICCPKCGFNWRDEKKYELLLKQLEEADTFFDAAIPDFAGAYDKYNSLSKKLPNNSEAYWKKLLSRHLVKLQSDEKGVLHPTCFGSLYEPIMYDPDFLNACKYANEEKVNEYTRIAEEINKICESLNKLKQNPHNFDLFISYKSNSDDEKYARELYEDLTKNGKNVFFSKEINKLYNGLEAQPEAIIYDALMHSRGFIIVSSTIDCYEEDCWVKNEIERFIYRIKQQKDKDSKLYFDCASQNPDIFKLIPPSIKNIQEKNFVTIDKNWINIVTNRLNEYVGKKRITVSDISDDIKISLTSETEKPKKKVFANVKKTIINIGGNHEKAVKKSPIIIRDEGQKKQLLKGAFDDLASGTKFAAAEQVFEGIYTSDTNDVRAAYGLLLAKSSAKTIRHLPSEKLKNFDKNFNFNVFDVLEDAINYFSNDDRLKDEDRIEIKIYERVCDFVKESILDPKLFDINACLHATKLIKLYSENDFAKDNIDNIFDAFSLIDGCKKIPTDAKYFDFLKLLLSCVQNNEYKEKLQNVIAKCIQLNSKDVVSKLLDYYLSLCGEDGFYVSSKIKFDNEIKTEKQLILYLLKEDKIDKLEDIIKSMSQDEADSEFELCVSVLNEEFEKCTSKLGNIGNFAKIIFSYSFKGDNESLENFLVNKLIESPILECNDLIVDLVIPYIEDEENKSFYIGQRFKYLRRKNKDKTALDFIDSACRKNNSIFSFHKTKLNLLLGSENVSKSVNIRNILHFDKNDNVLSFMYAIVEDKKDRTLIEEYEAIVKNLCFECIKSLKKYKSKAEKIIGYFDYFVKFIFSTNSTLRCECFKFAVEECLKNKIFTVKINNRNVIENYCNDLIYYSFKLYEKGEYDKNLIQYYIYQLQVRNKARTQEDLIYISESILTKSPENNDMLEIVRNNSKYEKQYNEFRENVAIPQSKILEKRKQRRD